MKKKSSAQKVVLIIIMLLLTAALCAVMVSTLKELIDSTITNDPITPFGSLALDELGVIF